MESEEPINVETVDVRCEGGGGPLGHPLVYMDVGKYGDAVCPYCSRHYVLAKGAKGSSH